MSEPGGFVELHLLRHAHAGDGGTWDGDDDLRPLTEKGRRQAERVGRLLAASGVVPDALLASPLVRARQTAEIVGEALGVQVRLDRRLGEGLDLGDLEALLADAGRPRRPLLVGHDPDFSHLASSLVGARVVVRKGALLRIDAEIPLVPGTGELRWLVPPELLRG